MKQKKENKQKYDDRLRTGFTIGMSQIDLSIKQDLSTGNNWKDIKSNNK